MSEFAKSSTSKSEEPARTMKATSLLHADPRQLACSRPCRNRGQLQSHAQRHCCLACLTRTARHLPGKRVRQQIPCPKPGPRSAECSVLDGTADPWLHQVGLKAETLCWGWTCVDSGRRSVSPCNVSSVGAFGTLSLQADGPCEAAWSQSFGADTRA